MNKLRIRPLRSRLVGMQRVSCRYFTHYGNSGVPGECNKEATLRLLSQNDIYVCEHHAHVITLRFPSLGDVAERFAPL